MSVCSTVYQLYFTLGWKMAMCNVVLGEIWICKLQSSSIQLGRRASGLSWTNEIHKQTRGEVNGWKKCIREKYFDMAFLWWKKKHSIRQLCAWIRFNFEIQHEYWHGRQSDKFMAMNGSGSETHFSYLKKSPQNMTELQVSTGLSSQYSFQMFIYQTQVLELFWQGSVMVR